MQMTRIDWQALNGYGQTRRRGSNAMSWDLFRDIPSLFYHSSESKISDFIHSCRQLGTLTPLHVSPGRCAPSGALDALWLDRLHLLKGALDIAQASTVSSTPILNIEGFSSLKVQFPSEEHQQRTDGLIQ
jgi:hypothetical protein